jgi:hypothetical protein
MIYLSEVLNKRDDLDMIEADTIEEFMKSADSVLSGDTFINACVGGREWENKGSCEGVKENSNYIKF